MLFTERNADSVAAFEVGAAIAIWLSLPSPLPLGEVDARSAAGEGLRSIESLRPPHPNPLPNGERESRPACGQTAIKLNPRSALLGAVARRDLLVGRILGRLFLDHRIEDRQVGLVVARDGLPFLAIPLLHAGLVR